MTQQSEAVRSVIETTLRIAEAFDRRDLETLIASHYQGPESSMIVPGGDRVFGWEAVRHLLEMRIGEYEYSRTQIHKPFVSLFGDVAVVSYEQRTESRLHDIPFSWVGWVTDLLVRQGGRWLRVQHHASDQARG